MEKLKQSKIKMFAFIVIIVAVAFCVNWLYKNRRVHFEDDMMRQVNSSVPQGEVGFELYEITETEERYYPPVSKEKMERIQKDLGKILKNAKKIEEFSYSNVNDTFDIPDVEFLKYGKNIRRIHIAYANITDFSVLKNCRSLRDVDLRYSAIDRADDLLKLKYVSRLILMDTPLAQNEEEISRLEKAFPEAWIITE